MVPPQEADAEDEEQEEQLALQAPPETSLTLAPQLELVDGKRVAMLQSMMVKALVPPPPPPGICRYLASLLAASPSPAPGEP